MTRGVADAGKVAGCGKERGRGSRVCGKKREGAGEEACSQMAAAKVQWNYVLQPSRVKRVLCDKPRCCREARNCGRLNAPVTAAGSR